ncbi:hypothetical protein C7435_0017 [Maricaulis maris]|uniref:Uncharacterized protein n=1 Tax=Maricaulis maris TaxID=74318 RepID=A0A495DMU4_9PROT|nr:hypothetical protein C7435_0017 [Maricaulis maris]
MHPLSFFLVALLAFVSCGLAIALLTLGRRSEGGS